MQIFIKKNLKMKEKLSGHLLEKGRNLSVWKRGNLVVKCAFGYVNSKKCFFIPHNIYKDSN